MPRFFVNKNSEIHKPNRFKSDKQSNQYQQILSDFNFKKNPQILMYIINLELLCFLNCTKFLQGCKDNLESLEKNTYFFTLSKNLAILNNV